jgi:hypothetical protein
MCAFVRRPACTVVIKIRLAEKLKKGKIAWRFVPQSPKLFLFLLF